MKYPKDELSDLYVSEQFVSSPLAYISTSNDYEINIKFEVIGMKPKSEADIYRSLLCEFQSSVSAIKSTLDSRKVLRELIMVGAIKSQFYIKQIKNDLNNFENPKM